MNSHEGSLEAGAARVDVGVLTQRIDGIPISSSDDSHSPEPKLSVSSPSRRGRGVLLDLSLDYHPRVFGERYPRTNWGPSSSGPRQRPTVLSGRFSPGNLEPYDPKIAGTVREILDGVDPVPWDYLVSVATPEPHSNFDPVLYEPVRRDVLYREVSPKQTQRKENGEEDSRKESCAPPRGVQPVEIAEEHREPHKASGNHQPDFRGTSESWFRYELVHTGQRANSKKNPGEG